MCVCVCVCVCVCIIMYVCMHVRMYVSVYIFLNLQINKGVCVYIYIYIYCKMTESGSCRRSVGGLWSAHRVHNYRLLHGLSMYLSTFLLFYLPIYPYVSLSLSLSLSPYLFYLSIHLSKRLTLTIAGLAYLSMSHSAFLPLHLPVLLLLVSFSLSSSELPFLLIDRSIYLMTNLYVCMHACMYVCAHACIHTHVHVSIYMYICIYTCVCVTTSESALGRTKVALCGAIEDETRRGTEGSSYSSGQRSSV